MKIIEDGNLTGWLKTTLCVFGASVVYYSLRYVHSILLMSFGLFVAAIGGYSSRAHMLGIKPFDNSYKKARESYMTNPDKPPGEE